MRATLALVAGAAVAAAGAVILGEYSFEGITVVASGLLLGLFVGEAVTSVARRPTLVMAGVGAALAAGGMTWAGWIATGHEIGLVPGEGWIGVATAAVAAGIRTWWAARATGTRPEPAPTA